MPISSGVAPRRVIAGGLVAGLVVNLGELPLNAVILGAEWPRAMAVLHRPALGGAAIAWLTGMGFALGLVLAWLCGALRPRLGPGWRTPVIAGVAVWLIAYVLAFGWSHVMGVFPARIYWTTVLWTLFEVPLAALAAGSILRGDRSAGARPPAAWSPRQRAGGFP